MDAEKRNALIAAGTDISGAMERFMDNEPLYWNFLRKFTVNTSFDELEDAIEQCDWEQALTIAHNLKGISGGLGFTHLYDLMCAQVVLFRKDDFNGAAAMMDEITTEHQRLLKVAKNVLDI